MHVFFPLQYWPLDPMKAPSWRLPPVLLLTSVNTPYHTLCLIFQILALNSQPVFYTTDHIVPKGLY